MRYKCQVCGGKALYVNLTKLHPVCARHKGEMWCPATFWEEYLGWFKDGRLEKFKRDYKTWDSTANDIT